MENIEDLTKRKYQLHILLFLLKMVCKHGSFYPAKIITEKDLSILHDLSIKLNDFISNEIGGLSHITATKIIRQLAYQQIWLQNKLNYQDIGRILKLLSLSEINPLIDISQELQISIYDFVKATLIIFVWVNSHKGYRQLLIDDAEIIIKDKEKYRIIIDYLTQDISDIRKEIENQSIIKSERLEIFDQSIFYKFPILKINGEYIYICDAVLSKTITFYFIEILSKVQINSNNENALGIAFERYVEGYLKIFNYSYKKEKEILQNYNINDDNKVVDFLIECNNYQVLVECKSIIAHPMTKVLPKKEILIKSYKNSIIKAFAQGLTCAKKIRDENKTIYLLIITLDELYFGCSEDLLEEFIQNGLEQYYEESISSPLSIPAKNIFVISITDFERLVNAGYLRKDSIGEILNLISKNMVNDLGKYILFSDVLNTINESQEKNKYLDAITGEFLEEILNEVKEILSLN